MTTDRFQNWSTSTVPVVGAAVTVDPKNPVGAVVAAAPKAGRVVEPKENAIFTNI